MRLRNNPKCTQTLCDAPKHEFGVQWGWLGAFIAKKSRCDFVARTFALIATVHPVLHRVSCSYETIQNAPKHYATHQNMSLGSNGVGWAGCVRREKSQRDFVARAFALTALLHPVLHRVSCGYETIPNASKHYATHHQMSLGSNVVDSVRWLQKNPYVTSGHELLH